MEKVRKSRKIAIFLQISSTQNPVRCLHIRKEECERVSYSCRAATERPPAVNRNKHPNAVRANMPIQSSEAETTQPCKKKKDKGWRKKKRKENAAQTRAERVCFSEECLVSQSGGAEGAVSFAIACRAAVLRACVRHGWIATYLFIYLFMHIPTSPRGHYCKGVTWKKIHDKQVK